MLFFIVRNCQDCEFHTFCGIYTNLEQCTDLSFSVLVDIQNLYSDIGLHFSAAGLDMEDNFWDAISDQENSESFKLLETSKSIVVPSGDEGDSVGQVSSLKLISVHFL